jgi:hypothetical protein
LSLTSTVKELGKGDRVTKTWLNSVAKAINGLLSSKSVRLRYRYPPNYADSAVNNMRIHAERYTLNNLSTTAGFNASWITVNYEKPFTSSPVVVVNFDSYGGSYLIPYISASYADRCVIGALRVDGAGNVIKLPSRVGVQLIAIGPSAGN